jgi:hypothetical protein
MATAHLDRLLQHIRRLAAGRGSPEQPEHIRRVAGASRIAQPQDAQLLERRWRNGPGAVIS